MTRCAWSDVDKVSRDICCKGSRLLHSEYEDGVSCEAWAPNGELEVRDDTTSSCRLMSLVVCGGSGALVEQHVRSRSQAVANMMDVERMRCHKQQQLSQLEMSVIDQAQNLKDTCDKVRQLLIHTRWQLTEDNELASQLKATHTQGLNRLRKRLSQERFDVILGLEALRGQACATSHCLWEGLTQLDEYLLRFVHRQEECLSAIKLSGPHLREINNLLAHSVISNRRCAHKLILKRIRCNKLMEKYHDRCRLQQARAAELQISSQAMYSLSLPKKGEILQQDGIFQQMFRDCECNIAAFERKSGDAAELSRLGCCLREDCARKVRSIFPGHVSVSASAPDNCVHHFVSVIRDLFMREYGARIRRHLFECFPQAAKLDLILAPMAEDVQARFLDRWKNGDGPSINIVPAFHGTNVKNLGSIFSQGLLIPGQGNRLRVVNGAVHGRGIYAAKVTATGRQLSAGFAKGNTNGMLVCAVLDDAIPVTAEYKLGYRFVTAESKFVRHVGDAFVIFDPRMILPLFHVVS